jgi:hypothetical protein
MNMKTITYKLLIALLALFCVSNTMAQFSMEGELRPRLEVRNGFKKPILDSETPAAFVEQRARITTTYKKEKLGFKVSVQDVRIWGEVGQINKSDQLLSAHEAYGEIFLTAKSTFRIGRQEVIYDEARFFGNLDWAMQGRSFDALRYLYKDENGNQFDFMGAWNQRGFGDGAPEPAKLVGTSYSTITGGGANPRIFNLDLPKAQFMGYYKRTLSIGSVALMVLNDNYHPYDSITYSDFTLGLSPDFKFDKLKVGGQFYYTGGKAGKDLDLSGYMLNAYVQHTGIFSSPLIGFDYLTGDDVSTTDKIEGWSPKYGTNHKFYGFMDYFYVGNGHGGGNAGSAGLLDVYLNTNFKLGEKTSLLGHVHYFASTAERTNAVDGKAYSGMLGTELDVVVSYKIADGIAFKAGYSQMFGITDAMKQLKFGNPNAEISGMQNWGWVMLAFTPKLFTKEFEKKEL